MSVNEVAGKAIRVRSSAQLEHAVADGSLYLDYTIANKMLFKADAMADIGGTLAIPGIFFSVFGLLFAGMDPSTMALGLGTFVVGGVLTLITTPVFLVGTKNKGKWDKIVGMIKKDETEKVKRLLYQNFGRSAGITPETIHECVTSLTHTWVHNGERYTVTRNEETGIYAFDHTDFFAGATETHEHTALQAELKPYYLKLKAADVSETAQETVKALLASVSKLARVELGAEQQHEVKRAIVDATELVEKSEQLAVFDPEVAQRKLEVGLRHLAAGVEAVALREKDKAEAALDGYNDYVASTTTLAVSS